MRISNGTIEIEASSFVENSSDKHAGALYLGCAPTCDITNTTFYANEAESYEGAISSGENARLKNLTFANNTAGGHGGALFGGGYTIFLDNSATNPWNQANICGETFEGSQVLQRNTESSDGGGDQCVPGAIAADPALTFDEGTHADLSALVPGPNSPALGAGTDCESLDQRDGTQDVAACDLGAIELE